VTFAPEVSRVAQLILADAQTSGGLLISLAADRAEALIAALQTRGVATTALIGEVTGTGTGHITVLP
jgi:selenide,water dikinase